MACELAQRLLEGHDFPELVRAIELAHSCGHILDPTLYREKCGSMDEDANVFRAAIKFLAAWPKKEETT